jgi:hypothetical protein
MRRQALLTEISIHKNESQLIGALLYNIDEALKSSKKAKDASTVKQLELARKNAKDLAVMLRTPRRG